MFAIVSEVAAGVLREMTMENSESHRNLVERARVLARDAHAGQFRRDGVTPYVQHPEAVASRVAGDPIAEAAAWLHDVLEDTPLTAAALRDANMPEEVIKCVEALTKKDGVSYDAYLVGIKANPTAQKVKIADMLANLSDHPTERQIAKYAKGLLFLVSESPE